MPDVVDKETPKPKTPLKESALDGKEKQQNLSFGVFIDHKKNQLAQQEERVVQVADRLSKDSDSITSRDFSATVLKRDRLNLELQILDTAVEVVANERLKKLMPESEKTFWELNDGEQEQMRTAVRETELDSVVGMFEQTTAMLEEDYKGKYKGKSYDEMTFDEERSAREEAYWLDVRTDLGNEMAVFQQ